MDLGANADPRIASGLQIPDATIADRLESGQTPPRWTLETPVTGPLQRSAGKTGLSLEFGMKKIVKAALDRTGWELGRTADREAQSLADLSPADREIVTRVNPFTMTSLERRASLIGSVDHIVKHGIAGDIVECGVWRGGSMMLVALALMARGDTTRDLYLFDTFEGMSEPSE